MCTVLLPPGGYPIAVNKYIISYIMLYIIYEAVQLETGDEWFEPVLNIHTLLPPLIPNFFLNMSFLNSLANNSYF